MYLHGFSSQSEVLFIVQPKKQVLDGLIQPAVHHGSPMRGRFTMPVSEGDGSVRSDLSDTA